MNHSLGDRAMDIRLEESGLADKSLLSDRANWLQSVQSGKVDLGDGRSETSRRWQIESGQKEQDARVRWTHRRVQLWKEGMVLTLLVPVKRPPPPLNSDAARLSADTTISWVLKERLLRVPNSLKVQPAVRRVRPFWKARSE